MKSFLTTFRSLFFILSITISTQCYATIPMESGLSSMLEKVIPAVVNIRAQVKILDINTLNRIQQEHPQDAPTGPIPDKVVSVGSGVIVDAQKGYILTNAHVIADAITTTITLNDGRHYNAKIIGLDKASDIAVLQIHAKNLTALSFGDPSSLKVGDIVAAIGNPFGLNESVTSGIVSALGRTTLGIENFENFIQTDAPINPGNSGGALVNTRGELVGINTAILTPARGNIGIGFAIPISMAKSVMLQLIQFGDVKRGALGVGAEDLSPDIANALSVPSYKGAVITQIMPSSPAEKSGLQVGDIIKSINGSEIKNANDVVNAIAFMRIDSKAQINILRGHKSLDITTIITDPQQRQKKLQDTDPLLYGVSLKDFTLSSPIHGDVNGVIVVSLEEDTNAWHADLQPGDIITSANQIPVTNITELRKVASKAHDNILLHILRGSGATFLVVSKES